MLDAKTILLLMAFTAVPTAAVLVAVSRFYAASVRGVGYWTGANIALAAGLLMLTVGGILPGVVPRVGGNTLLVLTAALYYLAIMRLLGEPPRARLAWAVVAAAGVAFAFRYSTGGSHRLAVVTMSVALIILTGLTAARLLRPSAEGEQRVSHRFTGLLFLLGGTLMAIRLLHILLSDNPPTQLFSDNLWEGIILAGTHIIVMLMSLGFALMIVDQLASELNRLATLDSLTGIGNRRVFYARAELELARRRRKNSPLSVLMIDLDRFKSINDELGHATGDETLRRFAALVTPHLREYDFFARLGGEEFAVLLPDTSEDVAAGIADRLRQLTEAARLPSADFPIPTTISIGVAELERSGDSVDRLMQRADVALYAAKAGGRNRVMAASWLHEAPPSLSRRSAPPQRQAEAVLPVANASLPPEAE